MTESAEENDRPGAVPLLGIRSGFPSVEETDGRWRFSAAGRAPRGVVRPRTIEQVMAVIGEADEKRLAVIPCGNATGLDIGAPPTRYDLALCSRELRRIVAHDAGDMTVRVEAGASLLELNAALEPAGQWLPLDPARGEEVTVGGLIAADRSGPSRLAYGKVRDLLLGLKVVMADGQLVKGGGSVVKNVAGYDLPKLFAGSFGTLGMIVEATFKVLPRPAGTRLFLWPVASVADALDGALQLLRSRLRPMILEAVNAAAAETIGVSAGAALLIGLAGGEAAMDAQEGHLRLETQGHATSFTADRSAAVFRALRDFGAPATEEALVARMSTLPASLGPLLRRIESEAVARRVLVEISAHAGNGVAWCQLFEATDPRALPLFAEWLRVATREVGGWVVFEAMPEGLRGHLDPWGFSDPTVPWMVRIKKALDPNGVFSPGRFVGGI